MHYEKMYKEHTEFMKIFCEQMFRLGRIQTDSFNLTKPLDFIVSDQAMNNMYKESNKLNAEFDQMLKDLDLAFQYYHYHFPKDVIPDVYLFNGNFSAAATVGPNTLGIAKEMCLGKDHQFLSQSGIPNYILRKLNTQHAPIHAMQNILTSTYPQQHGENLLDFMIYNGKILYCLDAIFPDYADSIKIGYPIGKIEWCHGNEAQIWNWTLENKLLYSTQQAEFLKLTMDGPNTSGMPPEAPGNIASWLGWQIVRQYMDKFPNTSLLDLMTAPGIAKGEDLMQASGYRPD